jgi:hypothetical protein
MFSEKMKRRIAFGAVLATMLVIGGCNMGVGVSASVPAPWGSVNIGTSTHRHYW